MMTNLFSTFDPSSSLFSFSWMVIFIVSLIFSMKMWKISSTMSKLVKKMIFNFKKEVCFTLKKEEKGSSLMLMLIFIFVISMNFLALYPQIFSPTSHMTITLPLSLLFWLSLMMFGWTKNTNHMLSHLLPQGTPGVLMMFMVFIEMVSNLIRPITLCVRLTANLIAGHLLMTLLGNALISLPPFIFSLSLFIPLLLTILESAVACIQAYVFMTLVTLYTTEVK